MSATDFYRLPLAIGLAALYNVFFWEEKLGLNLPLFSLVVMALLLWLNPTAIKNRNVLLLGLGTILSAALVLLYNSGTAKVVHMGSLLLFAGFVHLPGLRSIFAALGTSLASYWKIPESIRDEWMAIKNRLPGFRRLFEYSRLVLIPIVFLLVFYLIFSVANPRFAEVSTKFWSMIGSWFQEVSFVRMLFWLSGFLIAVGLIFNRRLTGILKRDQGKSYQLLRKRPEKPYRFQFMGLKKEYRTGVLLIGMVNMLLLVNNVLDIDWIWFGFEVEPGMSLRQFVHEGTYLLILSILLSMGIMLHFFRANQNFYRPQGLLHFLSYLWIFQNGILVISVAMRNLHYISYHGLAYKRIGVFFFLLLTLFGLLTLLIKIRDQKSAYFLFQRNGWAVYIVAILLSLVNWDSAISQYNLTQQYPSGLDTKFLLEMSPKTLPILISHQNEVSDKLATVAKENGRVREFQAKDAHYRAALVAKAIDFQTKWENYSWLSWNYADAKTARFLEKYDLTLISADQ